MNRQQALKYDEQLSKELQDCAKNSGMDETVGKNIVENFIEFLPEDDIREMISLNHDPVVYSIRNVRLDMKNAILAGLEFAASINRPEGVFNYVQLLIVSILFIRNVARRELNGVEAQIVYFLHINDAYESGIREEKFVSDMQEWYKQRENGNLEKEKIEENIKFLYKMKVVDIINEVIYLKEKVWGTLK